MPTTHDRSWREWARRWGLKGLGAETGVVPLADTVQPVVIVDDASNLNIPPVLLRWGIGNITNTPVALQEPFLRVRPIRRPIRIMGFNITCSGILAVGVNDMGGTMSFATLQDTPIAARLTGPLGRSNVAGALPPYAPQVPPAPQGGGSDAICEYGVVTDRPEVTGFEFGIVTAIQYLNLDWWVFPSQYFWFCSQQSNVSMTIRNLWWEEYASEADAHLTSFPRGAL